MDFENRFNTLTRCLVERGQFQDRPFSLIDVGCGGGLPALWRLFEPSLRTIGIDPQIDECDRLQAAEKNPDVKFVPRFLRVPESHPFRQARGDRDPWTGNPWERTSSAQAMAILSTRTESTKKFSELNAWPDEKLVEPTQTSTLDELVAELALPYVDFIKIDVDGPDMEVLHSATNTFKTTPVLGCMVEVNYSGSDDPTDHTFHNMDRHLRGLGFDLINLSTRRCSVAALPATFRFDNAPHETAIGRVLQGDAIYLRDPCGWAQNPAARVDLDAHQLLKLACLFELFGAPDHSAELLRDHATAIEPIAEVMPLLHLLVNELDTRFENYELYIKKFQEDPTSFYPSRRPS